MDVLTNLRLYLTFDLLCFVGDDAVGVKWMDLHGGLSLYASHLQFLQEAAKMHNAAW